MWDMLNKQQRRIEELEHDRRNRRGDLAEPQLPDQRRLSRAGLLRSAALGVVAVAGASIVIEEQTGVAGATGGEGQTRFSSTSSKPTVTVVNKSTGEALTATSRSSTATAFVSNRSSIPGSCALEGRMTSGSPGTAGLLGTASSGDGVHGVTNIGSGVHGSSTSYGAGVFGENTAGGRGVSGQSAFGIAVAGTSGAYYGGWFSTGAEPSKAGFGGVLHLHPDQAGVTTPNASFGQTGDLWVDADGGLWFNNGSWTKLV
jgi:hypothetical protein